MDFKQGFQLAQQDRQKELQDELDKKMKDFSSMELIFDQYANKFKEIFINHIVETDSYEGTHWFEDYICGQPEKNYRIVLLCMYFKQFKIILDSIYPNSSFELIEVSGKEWDRSYSIKFKLDEASIEAGMQMVIDHRKSIKIEEDINKKQDEIEALIKKRKHNNH